MNAHARSLEPSRTRTVAPRRRPAGAGQGDHVKEFSILLGQVRAAGLLERRPGWYLARTLVLLGLFAVGFALLFGLGASWWQLLTAAYFGVLFTQTAFLAHDSAHKQIFESGRRGVLFSRVIGNLGIGLSYGWWLDKHSRHHAHPNTIGTDSDIRPGAVVFTPQDASRRTGAAGWLMARQGWFFFPILLLAGIDLHRNAVLAVLHGRAVDHRLLEGSLLAVRLLGFPVLVVLAAGPGIAAAFMGVQLAVFGFTMGGSFAPNHKGMPLIEPGVRTDYLRRQVLTSRNITGGWLIEKAMGGLNYQIEHHLFPSMPSINLRRARPLVRAYCRERGIRYTETTLLQSWAIVVRYLHRVGIKAADPFDCPAAAAFRCE
jgi:fatty acid desaturase